MLDNLLEIEVAYNLLQTADEGGDKGKDAFDAHYEKLKTDITVRLIQQCSLPECKISFSVQQLILAHSACNSELNRI